MSFVNSFEKTAASRYAKWLAKAHYGTTPKQIAKKEYAIARKASGKSGRDAFRQIKAVDKNNQRRISKGDPLGLRMDKKAPRDEGEYTALILKHKKNLRPVRPLHAKGSIATRDAVRKSRARRRNVNLRGVGDLKVGTAKEKRDRRIEYGRKYYKRPKVKVRKLEQQKEYFQKPEVKAKQKEYRKEYNKKTEVKARKKEYMKEYYQKMKAKKNKGEG